MQENYNGQLIVYKEYSNKFICHIDEVTLEADSLIEARKKIDGYFTKKAKQKPIICYIERYGQIYEAKITSIADGKVYFTYVEANGDKIRTSERLSYITKSTFKMKNADNDKRFQQIKDTKEQIKILNKNIDDIEKEFENIDKIEGIELR